MSRMYSVLVTFRMSFLFNLHGVSDQWTLPSPLQEKKLRPRLGGWSLWAELTQLCGAEIHVWFCWRPKLAPSAPSLRLSLLQEAITEAWPGLHCFLLRTRRCCLLSREGRLKSM